MVIVGRKRGFVSFYHSSPFSVFGGSDFCFSGMFGGGELWKKFGKTGYKVLLLKIGCLVSQWVALTHLNCKDDSE